MITEIKHFAPKMFSTAEVHFLTSVTPSEERAGGHQTAKHNGVELSRRANRFPDSLLGGGTHLTLTLERRRRVTAFVLPDRYFFLRNIFTITMASSTGLFGLT